MPIHEVIRDLGKETGGSIREDANYYTLELPPPVGEGTISGIDFGFGFGMINYRCTFLVDTEISFELSRVQPLKFLYAHGGGFSHRFAVETERHQVDAFQNLVVASGQQNGHVLYFRAGVEVSVCSVEVDRRRFCKRFIGYFGEEEAVFRDLLFDVEATRQFIYEGDYALTIADHVETVLDFPRGGVIRSMFFEGKAYEILVDQWLQYVEDRERTKEKRTLRRATVERIKQSLDYIDLHLAADLSVSALVAHTGLTTAQLQQGFQHLTGMTVNNYVRERKLVSGMELLKTGKHNVSEAMHAVGFSSLSYFSRKFKERWGVSASLIGRVGALEEE